MTQETARTVHDLVRDLAPRREMIARLASLCWRPEAECYFFGCIERAGHYLWRRQGRGRPVNAHDVEDSIRHALADYPPEVLGVRPDPVYVWAPQPKHPPVEERVRGRLRRQEGGRDAAS